MLFLLIVLLYRQIAKTKKTRTPEKKKPRNSPKYLAPLTGKFIFVSWTTS